MMDGDAVLAASARVRQAFELGNALWRSWEQATEHAQAVKAQYGKAQEDLGQARAALDKAVCGVDY